MTYTINNQVLCHHWCIEIIISLTAVIAWELFAEFKHLAEIVRIKMHLNIFLINECRQILPEQIIENILSAV